MRSDPDLRNKAGAAALRQREVRPLLGLRNKLEAWETNSQPHLRRADIGVEGMGMLKRIALAGLDTTVEPVQLCDRER